MIVSQRKVGCRMDLGISEKNILAVIAYTAIGIDKYGVEPSKGVAKEARISHNEMLPRITKKQVFRLNFGGGMSKMHSILVT